MPYGKYGRGFERANRLGHVPLANDRAISEAMARWEVLSADPLSASALAGRVFDLADLPGQDAYPEATFAMSFDGSVQEVQLRADFPSVRAGFLQIAGVVVDLSKFYSARDGGLVDPVNQTGAVGREILDAVLPGSGVTLHGKSGVESWREDLYNVFCRQGISDFGRLATLLDALDKLYGDNGSFEVGRCPTSTCSARDIAVARSGSPCPSCGRTIWPTDVLRSHEEYDPNGTNLTSLTWVMNVCERLLMLLYIDGFASTDPQVLQRGAFVTDGPLALFGSVAPLKRRLVRWFTELRSELAARGLLFPLIVGIEKSGVFVDHAAVVGKWMRPGQVFHLTDEYIRSRVVRRAPDAGPYGADEFYGRRFFYKTSTEKMLVVSVPRVRGQPYGDAGSEELADYPSLRSALTALDFLQTSLYNDAVVPVALAHGAAAIPLGTGTTVLQALAKKVLGI